MADRPILYFDYDGTLHNSMAIYEPAFRQAYQWLVHHGHTEFREIASSEISGWLGLTKHEMWQSFLPELAPAIVAKAGHIIGSTMIQLIEDRKASLYEGVSDVLTALKNQGYTMAIVSNCGNQYMEAMKGHFNLDRWFNGYYTAEAYDYMPKSFILEDAIKKMGKPAIMIGDRSKDIIAGKDNSAITIGCTYGYGTEQELLNADYLIEDILDLPGLLKDLLGHTNLPSE